MPAPHRKAKPTLPDRREKDVRHLRSGCAPSLPGMAYIFARDVRHLHPGQSGTSPAAFSRRKKRIRQNSKPISLPLTAKALSWLPESREQDAPIFALPSYTTIRKHLQKWAEDAGLDKHLHFHLSRHTYGTMLITAGVDLYTASKMMGHADVRTTQIYAKIVDSKKIEAVDMVDKMFEREEATD